MNATLILSVLLATLKLVLAVLPNLFLSISLAVLLVGSVYFPQHGQRPIRFPLTVSAHTVRRLKQLGVLLLLLLLDGWLLRYFNTTHWPYLWPRPALYYILGALLLFVWLGQDARRRLWLFRLTGFLMVFIGQSYLLHSFQRTVADFSLLALLHLVGVCGSGVAIFLNFVNQFSPRDNNTPPPLPEELPVVAAVIATYNEPLDILEETLRSLKELDYPAERLFILISDDGHREMVQRLAQQYQAHFNFGARREAKAGNLNSALAYLREHCPQASLILTQDADEVIHPGFLKKTVGYFSDPQIAFVQTPKEAITPDGDPFGTRDRIFYDRIQPGRNGHGAAFSCGSGVIWRIAAVESIEGYETWNLVEDLTTSYQLHRAGWRSQYHNEILTIGLAPDDIPNLLKQRGTWAADTWRLFLFRNPLRASGLTLRQRLHYIELCLFYVTDVFFVPMIMLVPLLSLATGRFLSIEGSALFTWMAITFLYYAVLAGGRPAHFLRMWQYWVGHWPTYTKALWIALRSRKKKPQYKVTLKTRTNGFYGKLLWPQFGYILLGIVLSIRSLFFMHNVDFVPRLTNVGIFGLFAVMLAGICRAAFYGVEIDPFSGLRRPLEKLSILLQGLNAGLRRG
jgi:cellulose synthase (UDP-forming)